MQEGTVYQLLENVYKHLGIAGDFAETKKRMIRIRLSLKTGLSINRYNLHSVDMPEDVYKIIDALKSPEFGLKDFSFKINNT